MPLSANIRSAGPNRSSHEHTAGEHAFGAGGLGAVGARARDYHTPAPAGGVCPYLAFGI